MNQSLPPIDRASPIGEGPAAHTAALTPVEPSRAGQDPWREEARISVMCLQMENPEMSREEIAALLGLRGSRFLYAGRAFVTIWRMKYRRFLVAENRWGYLRALSPFWLLRKLVEGGDFWIKRLRDYRALRAELRVLEEDA